MNKNMTQKQLSQKSNVSISYISDLELGNRKNPSYKILIRIARALNVTIEDLEGKYWNRISKETKIFIEFFLSSEIIISLVIFLNFKVF